VRVGQEIEQVRKLQGLSIFEVCNAMNLLENEYAQMVAGHIKPTTYQLIMFVSLARHHLKSVCDRIKP